MDFSTALSLAGLIVSIAGLIVTVITLRKASDIQRDLLTRQRLPALLKTLKKEHAMFNDLLNDGSTSFEVLMQSVVRMDATLDSIVEKWKSSRIIDARASIRLIALGEDVSRSTFETFYATIGGVVVSLEHRLADNEWRIG